MKYPSDITREQFNVIEPLLTTATKRTRPREIDLYNIFCAILYIVKSGCQWRMLPTNYPKWYNVYYYFKIWSKRRNEQLSLLEQALTKLVAIIRVNHGRKAKTSFCIIDSQSVKNTDSAEDKGYDAGKKVSGIKRHIAVDTQGLPHAIHITTANITDRDAAIAMIGYCKNDRLSGVINYLVDGGYSGEKFATEIKNITGATVEVAKRNELHRFVVIPKRWVVERSFSWLEKCRRLWKNCERKINTSLQMVNLAFLALLLKKF